MLGFVGLCWALLGFAELCWDLLVCAGFCWALLGFAGLCWALLGFAGLCKTLLGFAGLCSALLAFTGFCWALLGFGLSWGRLWKARKSRAVHVFVDRCAFRSPARSGLSGFKWWVGPCWAHVGILGASWTTFFRFWAHLCFKWRFEAGFFDFGSN